MGATGLAGGGGGPRDRRRRRLRAGVPPAGVRIASPGGGPPDQERHLATGGARRNLQAALRTVTDRLAGVRASLVTTAAGAQAATDLLFQEAAPYQAGLAEFSAVDPATLGAVVQPATLPSAPSGPGPLTAA